ncbi:SulP family inorganic anion transporter [Staphylococcus intermedius]|uniref:Sulfate permease family protein n=1 Tax=Staphylococcus intermedius NCTC 11048 TaxID=1141106 RepID=A0A380G6P2_STAIN|nr:SulP family inorganic anion transporter [Staphylococcus intermedius]PCF86803.1 sulfate permease [Staphylococcus intermedius]PCF89883.1 sulfate permease [Staphylococcus intermedius]PNZ55505.1 SulP family inorganic anion transporter [Staphylococcus intermedius NCTC 11048]SUM45938.1 sulfate permease family protein [Staphylococcus intermedius NCTC 11048]
MGHTIQNYLTSWKGHTFQNITAGLLVALAMMPGAIAFAFIAGVSPTVGIFSTALMLIGISFLGSRTLMVSAPSSGVSIVAVIITSMYGQQMLIAAMLVMGVFQIIFAFCRVDKAIHQIPVPVVVGFMNALAYLLFTSQLKHIFGHNLWTYLFAILSLIMIFLIPYITERIPAALILIVVLSIAAKIFHADLIEVQDLARIHLEIPMMGLPHVDLTGWMAVELIFFGLMLAIVATIQTSLTARMVDQLTATSSSLNRESFGQGLTNCIISLFGGLAGSALVGQSKYNIKLGATSRLSTLVAGIVMLLFLFVLSPLVGSIPMVVLAIVLTRIAMNAFDRQTLRYIVERRWSEFMMMLITFLLIVIAHNLALGVFVGTAVYYSYQRIQKYRKGRDQHGS